MKLRPNLPDPNSSPGLEVVQLTETPAVPACHTAGWGRREKTEWLKNRRPVQMSFSSFVTT